MKRLFDIFLILALALAANACTLMLDEPEVTDDDDNTPEANGDGFSAPRTETNEMGSVTYQFKEGVRVIDENYRPYIVRVEANEETNVTKTYLLKSIPADMLPVKGDLLVTTLEGVYPVVVNDRVDVVENGPEGSIVVVSHGVDLNEVFKELDFEVAGYIIEDNEALTRSGEKDPSKTILRAVGLNHNVRSDDDWDYSTSADLCSVYLNIKNGLNAEFNPFDIDPINNGAMEFVSAFYLDKTVPAWGKIRWGLKSADFAAFCYFKAKAMFKFKYSLTELFAGELRIKTNFGYGYEYSDMNSYVSVPIFSTTSMTTPKDGIFPEQNYLSSDAFLTKADEIVVGIPLKYFKMGIAINLGITADYAMKYESNKPQKYEQNYDWEPFIWKFHSSLLPPPVKVDLPRMGKLIKTEFKSTPSNYSRTSGYRINIHGDISMVFSAMIESEWAGISVRPAKINLDMNYKSVEKIDYDTSDPLTLEDGNGFTLHATDKSYDDGDLTVGLTFAQEISIDGKAADFLRKYGLLDLCKQFYDDKTKPKVYPYHYSPFPQLEATLKYDKAQASSDYAVYMPTVQQEPDREVKFKGYRNIRLLVYDSKYKFIKECTPEETNAEVYDPDEVYQFKPLTMAVKGEIGGEEYFYVVPCYDSYDGRVNYFCRPKRIQIKGDWGRITEAQPVSVVNTSEVIEPNKMISGFAFTGNCSFEVNDVNYVYVRVKFLDEYDRAVYTNTYQYSVDKKKKSKTVKAVYLVKHNINVDVRSAVVTMFYQNPYKQNALLPSDRETVLDERKVSFEGFEEDWPEYDYLDNKEWRDKGYKEQ